MGGAGAGAGSSENMRGRAWGRRGGPKTRRVLVRRLLGAEHRAAPGPDTRRARIGRVGCRVCVGDTTRHPLPPAPPPFEVASTRARECGPPDAGPTQAADGRGPRGSRPGGGTGMGRGRGATAECWRRCRGRSTSAPAASRPATHVTTGPPAAKSASEGGGVWPPSLSESLLCVRVAPLRPSRSSRGALVWEVLSGWPSSARALRMQELSLGDSD